jgi:hypothetical protein
MSDIMFQKLFYFLNALNQGISKKKSVLKIKTVFALKQQI